MRNCLVFILILANKLILACGFYPFGEDIRISLFNPRNFRFQTYAEFYYSANSFGSFYSDTLAYPPGYVEPNTKLWVDYCKGKVDAREVSEAVYSLTEAEIDESSSNEMVQYLFRVKDLEALEYLRFAKRCEFLNSWEEDPWERQVAATTELRSKLMKEAEQLGGQVKKKEIKRRYIFLAIRLAWYNQEVDHVRSLFSSVFENETNKDIIYYWSLYFNSLSDRNHARANFQLAQVFAHAVDKRFACHQHYNKNIPPEQAVAFAQTSEEKANIYLLAGIERFDKTLPYLQKMVELNPRSEGLSFLLLREINKIEDFVLTPYYTLFEPAVMYSPWSEEAELSSAARILKRAERDREYAAEVLRFVNSVNLDEVQDPFFWQSCKAYLQFMTRDYKACLKLTDQLKSKCHDSKLINQLNIMQALALTAGQQRSNAIIPKSVQATLLGNQRDAQFIYAIGKELEYLGNTTDAALLYARLTKLMYEESDDYEDRFVYWKSVRTTGNSYQDVFTEYFDYVDVVYSPFQTLSLIRDVVQHSGEMDSFSVFKYEVIGKEVARLYDLLGTKYIRQNKLDSAVLAFEKAGYRYWNRAYTSWEDHMNVFDQNPFFFLKYTPAFIPYADTIRLNKLTVTRQLIGLLERAEDKNESNRDYYYFLVANAYYNMGKEGNIWMMRRFSGWSGYALSSFEDEAEFRQSNLARQYYLKAMQNARSDKFRALCLRMITRCEKHKLEYRYMETAGYVNYDSLLATNSCYVELQKKYPAYFDDLSSNCDNFGAYFAARR